MSAPNFVDQIVKPVSSSAHSTRIVQISAQLDGVNPETSLTRAREKILRWAQEKVGRLPRDAFDGAHFDVDHLDGVRAVAVRIDTPNLWAVRVDDPDKKVPGRTWVTEAGLGLTTDMRALFGVRLTCITRNPAALDPLHSVPKFVRQIAAGPGLHMFGRRISKSPWILQTLDEVSQLVGIIKDPLRVIPVYVASLASGALNGKEISVDLSGLAERTVGVALVVGLPKQLTWDLTERLGRDYSVYNGALRTYRPGFSVNDSPHSHPIARSDSIANFPPRGAESFSRRLVLDAIASSVKRPGLDNELPPFATIKSLAAKATRSRAEALPNNVAEVISALKNQVSALEEQLDEQCKTYDDMLDDASNEIKQLEEEAAEERSEAYRLKSRLQTLEIALAAASGGASPEITIPSDYAAMDAWVSEHLAGRVRLLPRAVRALKEARYHDVGQVYRCLLVLGNEYSHAHSRRARSTCSLQRGAR